MELPDWLRGIVLIGKDGDEYRIVGVNDEGYLGAVLMADAAVTIADNLTVEQDDSVREMQGVEGATLRTVAVDANGQIIMVPRGAAGNYMAVDANGFLSTLMKGIEGANLRTLTVDASGNMISVIKGLEGANLRSIAVDDAGRLITLIRGAAGNILAVDTDGFMTTVMKGTYGATLKTLATDDEGYLVAILKDNSDQWGEKISVGLAELAARLGSPISWDRRGQVAKILTFAQGLAGGFVTESGTGASATLTPTAFQTGGYSYKLMTGTTANKSAGVTIYGNFSPSDRMGFEFAFSMDTQPDDVYLLGKVWDGVKEHRVFARIHNATNKLQIQNGTPAYVDAASFGLPTIGQLFVSVKVVVDLAEEKWVRLLLWGLEYDISATTLYSPAVGGYPYFSYQILAVETGVVSHTIYLDRMIVTTNEP